MIDKELGLTVEKGDPKDAFVCHKEREICKIIEKQCDHPQEIEEIVWEVLENEKKWLHKALGMRKTTEVKKKVHTSKPEVITQAIINIYQDITNEELGKNVIVGEPDDTFEPHEEDIHQIIEEQHEYSCLTKAYFFRS